MMLSWLVLAVFAMAIAGLFVSIPSAVLPVNIEILLALIMGYVLYLKKIDIIFKKIKEFENGKDVYSHLNSMPATESFSRLN